MKNGTDEVDGSYNYVRTYQDETQALVGTAVAYFNAGDYIQFEMKRSSDGDVDSYQPVIMSVTRISGSSGGTGSTGTSGDTGGSGGTGAHGAAVATGGTGEIGQTGGSGGTGSPGQAASTGGTGGTGNTGSPGSAASTGGTGGTGDSGQNGLPGETGGTGGIGKTRDSDYFDAYDALGNQTFTSTGGILNINVVRENNNPAVFSLSNDEVTVSKAGKYMILIRVSTCGTSNTRTVSRAWLEIDNGVGFTEITGSIGYLYNRNGSEGETTCTIPVITDLNADSKVRIGVAVDSGGTSVESRINASSISIWSLVGPTGQTGGVGSTGSTGSSGGTGGSGASGSSGNTGGTGGTGLAGSAVATGGTGASGLTGGSGGTGSRGLPGPAALTGGTGGTGDTGSPGPSGSSGGTGQPGVDGLPGSAGDTGGSGGTGSSGQLPYSYYAQSSEPTGSRQSGDIWYRTTDATEFIYDGNRNKWLSRNRVMYGFGGVNNVSNGVFRLEGGALDSNTGYYVHKNATILSISGYRSNTDTADITIVINGTGTTLSFNWTGNSYASNNENFDIIAGSVLHLYSSGTCSDPGVKIEIAWRP